MEDSDHRMTPKVSDHSLILPISNLTLSCSRSRGTASKESKRKDRSHDATVGTGFMRFRGGMGAGARISARVLD